MKPSTSVIKLLTKLEIIPLKLCLKQYCRVLAKLRLI